jgi:putative hydrolase of the HAD superfamily
MVEALLFDLGGVVLAIDWELAFARWARDSGVPVALIRSRYHLGETYWRYERGEIGEAEFFASLRETLGVELDDDAMLAGWSSIFAGEIPETAALLRMLDGRLPLYAFSNTNAAHQREWARRYPETLARFRRVFVSHEIKARKPERESFELVARGIGVAPARILFFDDLAENVEGARAAGLAAVHVKAPLDIAAALRRHGIPGA